MTGNVKGVNQLEKDAIYYHCIHKGLTGSKARFVAFGEGRNFVFEDAS